MTLRVSTIFTDQTANNQKIRITLELERGMLIFNTLPAFNGKIDSLTEREIM